MFDCLHDMGDPVGSGPARPRDAQADGTWMIVEPNAGDRVEENINPVGRAYYGFSTLLCTPASLSQSVGLALGAQAGEARIGEVVEAAASDTSAAPRRLRSTWSSRPARDGVGHPRSRRGHGTRIVPATSSATACGCTTRSTAPASRPSSCCRRGRSSTHGTGRCRSPTWPGTAAVLTFDGRGNGRSDRPATGYGEDEFAADALAVMDATATDRALIVSLSVGAQRGPHPGRRAPGSGDRGRLHLPGCAVRLAARGPDAVPLGRGAAAPTRAGRNTTATTGCGTTGLPGVLLLQMFTEPHSTKPIEDCVGWGLETTAETLVATEIGNGLDEETARELCGRIRCPALVIQGTADAITGPGRGTALAAATGGDLVLLEGSGHGPHVRDPVKVNLLLRDFAVAPRRPPALGARPVAPQAGAVHLLADRPRPRPAGRGDRRRAAQAASRPGDRLARPAPGDQRCWRRAASAIHPASAYLASESGHIESESAEHDLHCLPGHRGGWTRSCSPTSWSSTTSSAKRTTTCGSATRPGSSTTTCTRTPS